MSKNDPLKYWTIDAFEISTHKYHLSERVNSTHTTSGSDNTGLCRYTYNELGFRGESITKKGFKIMSLGCSITEGVGVNDDETWSRQFCKMIPNSVDMNFGTGGRSNDFIARCLLTYFDLIKPDLVLILYTYPHRREVYTEKNNVEPFIPISQWGFMVETEEGKNIQKCLSDLQNKNSDIINWYKNHLLIKYFLESKKCNWIWNGVNLLHDYNEFNRFDGDGRYVNEKTYLDKGVDKIHPGPKQHYSYAKLLYDHIIKNFKHYLNDTTNVKLKTI
jgi:hypothetical protein